MITPCPRCSGPRVLGGCLATTYPCCRRCDLGAPQETPQETPKSAEKWTAIAVHPNDIPLFASGRLDNSLPEYTFFLWSYGDKPSGLQRFEVEGECLETRYITVPAGTRVRRVESEEEWFVGGVDISLIKDGRLHLSARWGHNGRIYPAEYFDRLRIRVEKIKLRRRDCVLATDAKGQEYAQIPLEQDVYFERLP